MKKTPFWWGTKKRKTLAGSLERSRAKLLEKFQKRREAAAHSSRAVPPPTVSPELVARLIKDAERAALKAGVPRPKFPFEPGDVIAIHARHRDDGEGVWFRLADGRVFRDTGEPCVNSSDAYI